MAGHITVREGSRCHRILVAMVQSRKKSLDSDDLLRELHSSRGQEKRHYMDALRQLIRNSFVSEDMMLRRYSVTKQGYDMYNKLLEKKEESHQDDYKNNNLGVVAHSVRY